MLASEEVTVVYGWKFQSVASEEVTVVYGWKFQSVSKWRSNCSLQLKTWKI